MTGDLLVMMNGYSSSSDCKTVLSGMVSRRCLSLNGLNKGNSLSAIVNLFGPINRQGYERADDAALVIYFGFDAGITADSST